MCLRRCRAPTTAQRDVKRARIVLLAAAGRSTRSIAADRRLSVVDAKIEFAVSRGYCDLHCIRCYEPRRNNNDFW